MANSLNEAVTIITQYKGGSCVIFIMGMVVMILAIIAWRSITKNNKGI